MKHIKYDFHDSDIETCLFALTKLSLVHEDTDGISDAQININEECAVSVSEKLIRHDFEHILPNEIRVLCCCIMFCDGVCHGEYTVSKDCYQECMKFMFSLNKLNNSLCSQI